MVLLGLTGCTPPGPKALLEGERYIQTGKWERAIEKLTEAVTLLPDNPQAWNHLGLAYHGARKADQAEKAYRKALEMDYELSAARYNLGCLYLEVNQFEDAAHQLTYYVRDRDSSIEALLLLGTAQLKSSQWRNAGQTYARAYKLNPKDTAVLNGLGLVQMQLKEHQEAARFFEASLASDKNNSDALLNLAILSHRHVGNKPQALELYREYLMIQPKPARASLVEAVVADLYRELNPPEPQGPKFTAIDSRTSVPPTTNAPPPTATPVEKPPVEKPEPPKLASLTRPTSTSTNETQVGIQPPSPKPPVIQMAQADPVKKTMDEPPVEKTPPKEEPTDPTPAPTPEKKPEPEKVVVTPPTRPKQVVFVEPEKPKASEPEAPGTMEKPAATPSAKKDPIPTPEPRGEKMTEPQDSPLKVASVSSETLPPDPTPKPEPTPEPKTIIQPEVKPVTIEVPTEPKRPEPTFEEKVTALSPEPVRTPPMEEEEKPGFFERLNPVNLFRKKDKEVRVTRLPGDPEPRPVTTTQPAPQPTTPPPAPVQTAATRPAPEPVVVKKTFPRYAFGNISLPSAGDRAAALSDFEAALEEHRARNYPGAMSRYQEAIRKDGSFYEAHYNLGLVALQLGQTDLALSSLEKAVITRPTSGQAHYNLGRALQKRGYVPDAIDEFEKSLGLDPENANAHLALGGLHAGQLGDIPKAKSHYSEFLRLSPTHPKAADVRYWMYRNQ